MTFPVDADLRLPLVGLPTVEDLDAVEERQFQVCRERVRDVVEHVRVDQGILQATALLGVDAEADGPGGDAVPPGNAAFVIGAGMVGEVLAPVQEFQHARTGGLHPCVGRLGGVPGDRRNAVHEARHVGLEARVRQRDQVVVVGTAVHGRHHADRPPVRAAQGVAFQLGPFRHTRRVPLQTGLHQSEELQVRQAFGRRFGVTRSATYPRHAVDLRARSRSRGCVPV